MHVYLEFRDDKSEKFWTITVEGASHVVRYGRIGSNGQTKTKEFADDDDAIAHAEKLVAQKRKKGYEDAEPVDVEPAAKKPVKKPAAKKPAAKKAKPAKRPGDRTIKSFFKAIGEGAINKVRKSVEGKMPVSIRFDLWGNEDERTPLIHALSSNQVDIATLLLDAGADPTETTTEGSSALHSTSNGDLAKRLIDGGAKVDTQDEHGRTPLHAATANGAIDVVQHLLDAGADVNAQDNDEAQPHLATASVLIRDLLYAAGAKRPPSPGGETLSYAATTVALTDVDAKRGAIGIGGDDALWVGSYSGIFRVEGDVATRFADQSGNSPAVGGILAGSDGATFFKTNCGLLRHRDGEFTLFNHVNSPLHDQHLTGLFVDGEGRAHCVGYERESESKHVSVLDGETWSLLRPDGQQLPANMEFKCGRFDGEGQLLLGTSEGVYTRVNDEWSLDGLGDSTFAPTVYDIAIAADATWFGTQNGVYRREDGNTTLREVEHLAKVICPDGEAVWVGTGYGGIYKLAAASGDVLLHLTEENTGHSLSGLENIVRSADGSLWVHTARDLYVLEDDAIRPLAERPTETPPVQTADDLRPLPTKPFLSADKIPKAFAAEVEKTELSGITVEQLLGLIRPAIGFDLVAGDVSIGASKFGGTPDLPTALEWPQYEDRDDHLPFVLQINLAETAEHDIEELLPRSGMLYLFSDTVPDDLDEWKVLFADATPSELTRVAMPKSLSERRDVDNFVAEFPQHGLSLRPQLTLPSCEFIAERCLLTDEDEDAIEKVRDRLAALGDGALPNQFLGWPTIVQGEILADESNIVLVQLSGFELSGENIHKYFEHWCSDGLLHWIALQSELAERNFEEVEGSMAYT